MKALERIQKCLGRFILRHMERHGLRVTLAKNPPLYFQLLREERECMKRARDYETSDPYLAGVNAGRAEILNRWARDESSDHPNDTTL